MGTTLFLEYVDVIGRAEIVERCALSLQERTELLEAYLSVCTWTRIYYGWRPNLRDEADNHLIELAVAGNADAVITWNTGDLISAELEFPSVKVVTPEQILTGEMK